MINLNVPSLRFANGHSVENAIVEVSLRTGVLRGLLIYALVLQHVRVVLGICTTRYVRLIRCLK